MTIQQALEVALQHHQAGRLAEAEAIYREILAVEPHNADALHLSGVMAAQVGQHEAAVDLIRRALEHKPDFADAHYNLGSALGAGGRLEEAIAAYRQALQFNPEYAEAHNNLGNALFAQGRLEDAIAAYHRALQLKPDYAEAHYNLGNALLAQGRLEEAIAAYHRALQLKPDYAEAHNNLGTALFARGQPDDAVSAYRRALEIEPDYADAYTNLGIALNALGQLDDAMAACHRALQLKPHLARAHNSLGNALKDAGQIKQAIACYQRAMALEPENSDFNNNLIHILHFLPGHDPVVRDQEQGRWNRLFAEPLRKFVQPHANAWDPERRLRIGYVSPDFRDHVVGRNVLPILERHDRTSFEIFCYASVTRADALTERFRDTSDVWRNIAGLSDDAAAELIRTDQIDILIDLTLHMANNRLLIFARKPAPVQVTWAGYPGTTGLDTMDYRITDPYLDPPGVSDELYAEESIRLPHSFWCYNPLAGSPAVTLLPALASGYVTFGSLNNYCKVNEGVIELWSKVLCAVKDSRFLLLSQQGAHRQRALELFKRQGVDAERIEWFTPAARVRYLEAYQRIDLGLDTFPYNGHTTSLDSFWMGVPVITLVGNTVVGRAGLSQAMNLGLDELVARTPEEYFQIAMDFAADLPRLSELRQSLRLRMQASPLMDAARFTGDMEAAYRTMWQRWCREKKPSLS